MSARTPGAGLLGMALFLASLGVLFAAAVVAFAVVRMRAESWPPQGAPALPRVLWLSTLLLVACSVAVQCAVADVRHGRIARMRADLWATVAAAALFAASQAWAWLQFRAASDLHGHGLYPFTFYMLTGLHGLHVGGGLVGLGWVLLRAHRGDYSWARHDGVRYTALYWHFLLGVWLALFAALLLAS